jgi:DNA-directed RNA polymerase beta' subunit
MSIYKELSNDQDIDVIRGIQFTVMSPEEIEKRSVVEVVKTDTYSGSDPVVGGLFDIRMGVIEHSKICKTCEQKNTFCPGHFGHITLAKPVFYYQFFDTVLRVLRCVCVHCSKMRISCEDPRIVAIRNKKISRQKRFDLIYKLCSKVTQCGTDNRDGCGMHHPIKMSKTNEGKILVQWKFEEGKTEAVPSVSSEHVLYAEDVIAIFKRITDTDADVMGFKRGMMRPEWLMCSVFPVPPPAVRPSVRNDTGQRCEDDLTHKLCDIVKTNNNLKKKVERVMAQTPPANGAPLSSRDPHIEGIVQLLQYHVFTFVNNNIPNVGKATQRTGRALRSIGERLKGKEGRIRGNLMGKRVDFSARSVITPDANISIDELGVPVKVAMNITFPEIVNKYNFERLKTLVRNGPDTYPGAKYLKKTKEDNRTIRLKTANREEVVLEFGDVVDRHMQDGDYVLFNRQPSLHKMSMMAHRVKVMPYDTFRLNVCVTASYNADFDGDEMNLHMPQSLQSANELISLASVPTQIISPAQAKPIISIVQDVALGVYLITNQSVTISQKQYFNLMSRMSRFNGTIPKASLTSGKAFTGKQAMSMVIPENVNLTSPNNTHADDPDNKENTVIIQNGEIIQGVIDKNIYQQQSKGLVHTIYNENGLSETTHLFDDTQRLICDFLVYYGFSIGISDLVVSEKTMKQIKEDVDNAKKQVYNKISDIHNNRFENPSIYTDAEYFETEVNNMLNKTADQLAKIGLAQIKADNRMYAMVMSKSKGNKMNIVQVMSALGQQNVDGKRIQYGYEDRTLPHFTKYDDGPETRGFIENSFMTGLKPHEFFFHAMGGREGLIDTAVKSVTAETAIVIIENGVSKYTRIGDWIDAHLEHDQENVKHFEERQMEMLYLKDTVYIPTTDYSGNVTWGLLTAVTRHDPGTELYEIKTKGGKSVTVTESKSLLVWNHDLQEFREIPTPEIKVGDFVPATSKLCSSLSTTFQTPEGNDLTGYEAQTIVDNIRMESCDSYIPDFVFTTPTSFIKTLMMQLLLKYGEIDTRNYIVSITSQSPRLLEGISMLCTMMDVYGEICQNVFTVREGWAATLAYHVYPTTSDDINHKLNELRVSTTYPNKILKDVVLDEIVEINLVDVSKHPKVYDVTVPSTLNFGLANGLQVRDTSETGYIQRKLVKGMEDCKITYDGTVRNANGGIVQFLYGEDGMNTIKLEGQNLRYIKFTPEEMANEYLLTGKDCFEGVMTKAAIKRLESNASWTSLVYDHFDQIKADREHLICNVFRNRQETKLTSAVAFERIIRMVSNLFCPNGNHLLCDLTPLEIVEELQKLEDDLHISPVNHGVKLFGILLRMWLSPKMVLFKHHLTKDGFYEVIQRIRKRFMEAIANPSEMVGVVAAQSIGEPCTQLTLNSVHYETELLLRVDGTLTRVTMGEWIDDRIEMSKEENIETHPNNTILEWIRDHRVEVLACGEDGKVIWDNVEAVTRHPVVNEDGTNTLIKITLDSGRTVTCTKAKSVLGRKDNKIVQVDAKDLRIGDYVPVSTVLHLDDANYVNSLDMSEYVPKTDESPMKETERFELDELSGFFCGAYLAEGYCTKHTLVMSNVDDDCNKKIIHFFERGNIHYHEEEGSKNLRSHSPVLTRFITKLFGNGSGVQRIPSVFFQANSDFLKGLIDGYFSGDGHVTQKRHKIYVFSLYKGLLKDLQTILTRFGVQTKIKVQTRTGQLSYLMSVCASSAERFTQQFTLTVKSKQERLSQSKQTYVGRYSPKDVIPNVVTKEWGTIHITRNNLMGYLNKSTIEDDISVYKNIMDENIVYDKIVSLEEIKNDHDWVYDLTTTNTKNFNTMDGICQVDTFHSSGQGTASKAVRGVPRLKELLSVSKNIKSPSMKIYVRDEFAHDRETCKEVKNDIQTTYIKDVVESSAIFYDPRQYDSEIAEDAKFLQSYHTMFPEEVQHESSPIPSPWVLRLTFNRNAMQELRIGMVDLCYILHAFYGSRIRCTYSDDNADELVMRIQIHESTADMVTELKAIEFNILENIVIKGTPGINKISIREETTTQYNQPKEIFETRKEYVMDTDGSNLLYILTNSKVDATRSITNDIVEIYEHLGIEAAREALTREIIAVLGDGLSVDYHHLSLLVDTMTMKGNLLSIDRHGINRSDIGPIAKCSFEETSDMLMKAGVFAEYDKINGVSANIMLGQIPPCGTGDSDIVMKLDKLPKAEAKDVSSTMTDDMISKCSMISKDMLFDFDLPEPSQHSDMFMP